MPLERPRAHDPLTRTCSLASLTGVLRIALSLAFLYRTNAVESLQRLKTDANVALTQAFTNGDELRGLPDSQPVPTGQFVELPGREPRLEVARP